MARGRAQTNLRFYVEHNVDVGEKMSYVQVLACVQMNVLIVVNNNKILGYNHTKLGKNF